MMSSLQGERARERERKQHRHGSWCESCGMSPRHPQIQQRAGWGEETRGSAREGECWRGVRAPSSRRYAPGDCVAYVTTFKTTTPFSVSGISSHCGIILNHTISDVYLCGVIIGYSRLMCPQFIIKQLVWTIMQANNALAPAMVHFLQMSSEHKSSWACLLYKTVREQVTKLPR